MGGWRAVRTSTGCLDGGLAPRSYNEPASGALRDFRKLDTLFAKYAVSCLPAGGPFERGAAHRYCGRHAPVGPFENGSIHAGSCVNR